MRDKKTERESAGGLADVLASSGEVHGVLGIIVDLNCLGQRLGVPAVTLTRHMAAFSTARQRKQRAHYDCQERPLVIKMKEMECAWMKSGIGSRVLVGKWFDLAHVKLDSFLSAAVINSDMITECFSNQKIQARCCRKLKHRNMKTYV